jgi:hypothetical protein
MLIGQEIPDEIGLLDAVANILNGISTNELQCVCHRWIEPVENVITSKWGMHPCKILYVII